MTFDPVLAERVRELASSEPSLTEKKMFGGVAFLINGNMAVSASSQGGIMVRIDPADADRLTADPHAERCVMRGRSMDGWLRVADAGLYTEARLSKWVTIGVEYANTLPPKS